MSQVPFPINISPPVRLIPPDHSLLAGRLVLTLSILAVVGAAALTGVRSGWFERFKTAPIQEQTPGGEVAGESVKVRDQLIDDLATFTVQPGDLPVALGSYHLSPDEGGSAEGILNSDDILTSARTVYAGQDPLDVFSSSVFLFTTRLQAIQAFYQYAQPDALEQLVGQPVTVGAAADRGQDSVVFRETSAGPDAARAFAGILLLNDRAVHLSFGFFPASITERDLIELVTPSLDRYRRDVPEARKQPDRDSDMDGLPNDVEEALGTDPKLADSDADGYADLTEVQSGYDPLGPGKQSSTDGLFEIPGLK